MPVTLRKNAYQLLRHRLVRGQLPPGSRISESALSREMGTSRGPVREAIKDLVNEGLIEQVGNKGTFVRKASREDIEDLYELREWMECEAAAKAAGLISAEHLAELEQSCQQLKTVAEHCRRLPQEADLAAIENLLVQVESSDAMFHLSLISACGNRQLLDIVAKKHLLSRMWGAVPSEPPSVEFIERLHREHCVVLESLRCSDAHAARESMRSHIRAGRKATISTYDRQQRQTVLSGEPLMQWSQGLCSKIERMEDDKNT